MLPQRMYEINMHEFGTQAPLSLVFKSSEKFKFKASKKLIKIWECNK
jgi:hypothetical protein